ncbi:hypothetical protein A1O1_06932 [Capronia coronata CBS 617.96]|uniref:NADH dehydrogenase [ubiquinone] 1 alpha subcomplex assembly factor 3 n=1 Tax=Capronia coronata CBS 617.96 TaxID=1182541 RepID=W9XSV6_9EURO|nr:uncharacterized protein A1O1_06932 [Capronia coronata CBS 617.96]EXJ83313.1 hypothetical protein A1O1_06932 [Capronia coronata CBS 617.96]
MRPPSTDLLRALRLATFPSLRQSAPSCSCSCSCTYSPATIRPACLAARPTSRCPTSSSPSPLLRRTIQTSSQLTKQSLSPGRPVSSPRRTENTNTSPTTSKPTATSDLDSRSSLNPQAPKSHDRGPASEEDTQTDFAKMDILTNAGATTPATSIDACVHDGFHLNNGVQTRGGLGVLLLDGEAFVWAPWNANAANKKKETDSTSSTTTNGGVTSSPEGFNAFLDRRGILTIPPSSLGIFELIYPRPDLLLIGTGRKLWMLGAETRKYLSEQLGIRVDIMDTANAAAAYNLLAMERGVTEVAGLMIPDGFVGK